MRHPLAHLQGIGIVHAVIALSGGSCPKCGYGTRVTSKRWAHCKKDDCDGRARRRTKDQVDDVLHWLALGYPVILAGNRVGKPAGSGPEHLFRRGEDITLCGCEWSWGWIDRETDEDTFAPPGERGPWCRRCLRSLTRRAA